MNTDSSQSGEHVHPGNMPSMPVSRAAPPPASVLRAIGSLWFAAVLLVMLLVAMACATVFESTQGTEKTLAVFYHALWFKLLLALLAVNSLTAIVLRYPFTQRHIGFLLTHASILVILGGALISDRFGVNGQLSVLEGQTVDHFINLDHEVITVTNPGDQRLTDFELDPRIIGGFKIVEAPEVRLPVLGGLDLEILRYLPDSEAVEHTADDGAQPNCAVEVSLASGQMSQSIWVFQNQTANMGSLGIGFRVITDAAELAKLIDENPTTQPASAGTVRIELNGATFDVPVEACLDKPAAVGETGYTVRVLRYLPHATVGPNGQIANTSERPMNPFIEAELSGPNGTETRKAFARFPEFSAMHSGRQKDGTTSQPAADNLKLTLVASTTMGPNTPIEVLADPEGRMYARFGREGGSWTTRELRLGMPVESPWPGRTFAVLRKFDHARLVKEAEPVTPARQARTPAILVKASDSAKAGTAWLRKDEPQTVEVGGRAWSLVYSNEPVPLGFKLTLNRFRMGRYPGESAPRSFESHISILDAATGREENKIISMNQPVEHAGFSLFQSSYKQDAQQTMSVLTVAKDPGRPIVFLGYLTMLLGMVIVMITRMKDRRRVSARETAAESTQR